MTAPITISPGHRPAAAPGVASVELRGEMVILDPLGHVHLLNVTGGLVWACFDGEATVQQIASEVAHAFRTPYDEVLSDVCSFAAALCSLDLLV